MKNTNDFPKVLVGNKADLPRREVDIKYAQSYAKGHHMPYVETSARTRLGVVRIYHVYCICVCMCVRMSACVGTL